MIIDTIFVLISVITIALAINVIQDRKEKNKTRISFRESMDLTDLPIITFHSGDKKLNFLLDTGSDICHIDSSVLTTIEHEMTTEVGLTMTTNGTLSEHLFATIKFVYKDINYEESFSIRDLYSMTTQLKEQTGVTIHGILGNQFFQKHKYVLDFESLTATIK